MGPKGQIFVDVTKWISHLQNKYTVMISALVTTAAGLIANGRRNLVALSPIPLSLKTSCHSAQHQYSNTKISQPVVIEVFESRIKLEWQCGTAA
jgi:hypothetical protein